MGVQSGDETVHHRLECFFGDWGKARRLHTSNERRASDRPWLCAPPWVLSSRHKAAARLLRWPCYSPGLVNVVRHSQATFSASS
jgi:hypothetical protein